MYVLGSVSNLEAHMKAARIKSEKMGFHVCSGCSCSGEKNWIWVKGKEEIRFGPCWLAV